MTDNFIHSMAENSCFFQGHKGQYFSQKFNRYMSFRVYSNYSDPNKIGEFNIEKYRPIFCKKINAKIALRKKDGGDFHEIKPEDLKIDAIRLIDNVREEGSSGQFEIYPPTALCTKDNCFHYFVLGEGRTCGHKNTDPWEQFTFLTFCDTCGRTLPLHYMSNILKDCTACGEKGSLSKLKWTRGKDDIGSYKVICKKCGNAVGLYFYDCDHTIHKTGECLSKCEKNRFRGVPARANALIHPFVISIPDIPQSDDVDLSGRKTAHGRSLSEAFNHFFGYDIDEAKLHLPEFKNQVLNEQNFWELSKVKNICDDLVNLDVSKRNDWNQNEFLNVIKSVLQDAKSRIDHGGEAAKIKSSYGIQQIGDSLNSVKSIDYDENDLEGFNLLNQQSKNLGRKEKPCVPTGYESMLSEFGLKKIIHHSNINMIQALLGVIEGSTRRDPILFRTIETGKFNNKKPTAFIRNFFTEGILFQLDFGRVLKWLQENKNQIKLKNDIALEGINDELTFRQIILNDENCKSAITTLLHTYSHMLIQQSTIDTGLDVQSISEIIYPNIASIFIYSTNSINIGGLEYTYDYHIRDWFSRIKELANNCPQDPGCMVDEKGACNACSYVPEFVCFNFNQGLDRSTLVGGSERFQTGYLNENQS